MDEKTLKIAKRIERLKREFSMLPPLELRHNKLELEEYQHYLLELEEMVIVLKYMLANKGLNEFVEKETPKEETNTLEVENNPKPEENKSEEDPVANIEKIENSTEIEEEAPSIEEEQISENSESVPDLELNSTEEELEDVEEPKIEFVPTGDSLNDQVNAEDDSLATKLAKQPINDLRQAFGLNERFLFANELFGGDGQEFIRALNELNHLETFEDAKRLIESRYQNNFNWKDEDENVSIFMNVVERRYL